LINSIKDSAPILKIAITGPESTGKSTLTRALAQHYQTVWVEEYARQYLDRLGRPYVASDLLTIAHGQILNEQKSHEKARGFLFCDTEPIVLKIWSQHKYGHVADEILEICRTTSYHHYLLMDIDLPWEYDPQREHPHEREFFFTWFERELLASGASYSIISGKENERLKTAISVIDSLLTSLKHRP